MPSLRFRSEQPELMDDLSLASDALRQNLDELETINTWLGGYEPIKSGLALLKSRFPATRPFSLADVGCGGGDTLRVIARWAARHQLRANLVGVDANAFMIDYATDKCRPWSEISFQQQDIFAAEFRQQRFDVLTCSLFCHHFSDAALVEMLRQLAAQARLGVVINDLHRHRLAYTSIKWLTRLLGGSYLVQNDAPLSVARAFRRAELVALCRAAGVRIRSLRWRWAFRWELVIEGQAAEAA
jgi:2-polyprenyl-3-methyl-5-hydroxy-6-metoxy-1,4-benzoquinol methylase